MLIRKNLNKDVCKDSPILYIKNSSFFFSEKTIFLFFHELFSPYLSCRRLLLGTQTSWGNVRTVSSVIMTAVLWSRTRVCEEEKVPVLSNLSSVNIMTKIKLVKSYNTPQNVWSTCLASRTIPFTFLCFTCVAWSCQHKKTQDVNKSGRHW